MWATCAPGGDWSLLFESVRGRVVESSATTGRSGPLFHASWNATRQPADCARQLRLRTARADRPGGDRLGAGPAEALEYALEPFAGAAAPAGAIVEHGVTRTPSVLEQAFLGCAARLCAAHTGLCMPALCWIATLYDCVTHCQRIPGCLCLNMCFPGIGLDRMYPYHALIQSTSWCS